jgi:hypothetical protein
MAKSKFGYVYSMLTCDVCGHDLTVPGGVKIEAVTDDGRPLGEFPDRLIPHHSTAGELADAEGMVRAGKHSQTKCGSCGEDLGGREFQLVWTTPEERTAALAEAVEECRYAD